MRRRTFLGVALGAILFPKDRLFSQEKVAGDPRDAFYTCPMVDHEAAAFIRSNFHSNLVCSNECLNLQVGGVRVDLYDQQSWVDMIPENPGVEVTQLPLSQAAGVTTLDELRARDLESYGFTRTPHEVFSDWQMFKLNGSPLSYIFHVVEDPRGRRYLSYGAYTPDDYRWYNDPIKPGLVGWVLGAHMLSHQQDERVCFSDTTSKSCLAEGSLSFRANALILLDR